MKVSATYQTARLKPKESFLKLARMLTPETRLVSAQKFRTHEATDLHQCSLDGAVSRRPRSAGSGPVIASQRRPSQAQNRSSRPEMAAKGGHGSAKEDGASIMD